MSRISRFFPMFRSLAAGGMGSASVCFTVLAVLAGSAHGACETSVSHSAAVAQVIDAHTLRLDDGSEVRLIGALAPETPRWWKGGKAWPSAERARRALESLIGQNRVELRFAGDETQRDRHERYLAQLFVLRGAERIWAQGQMIRKGFALAYSLSGHRACARSLQEIEAGARTARSGLWRTGRFEVLQAGNIEAVSKRRGSYQLVEGKVQSVGKTGQWTFLNFDKDWRTDFTIAIRARDRRRFQGSDVTLEKLADMRVRVRGWVERWNGPVIKVTHPEQIEVRDQVSGSTGGPAR